MSPMPEIDIEDVITLTYDYVRQDPRYLQDFFGDRPPDSLNDIFRFFKNERINIGPAYTRDERTLPAISILQGDGGTTDNYAGDYLGSELDDDNITTLFLIGERQRDSVEIEVASINSRQTSYMGAFIKAALILNRTTLNDRGLNEMEMEWQKKEIDNIIASGIPVFKYTISVSFMYNIVVAQRYGPTPETISSINIIDIPEPESEFDDEESELP